jgi:hypothetical protein
MIEGTRFDSHRAPKIVFVSKELGWSRDEASATRFVSSI